MEKKEETKPASTKTSVKKDDPVQKNVDTSDSFGSQEFVLISRRSGVEVTAMQIESMGCLVQTLSGTRISQVCIPGCKIEETKNGEEISRKLVSEHS